MVLHVSSFARTALAAALVAVVTVLAAAQAPGADPAAVVRALYRDHFAQRQRWDITFKRNRTKFTPELLALLDADERKQAATPDEVVGLDFDPITNAQDEATGYQITGTTHEGADAIVAVTVKFGRTDVSKVRVRLSPSGQTWRIANVLYDEGDLVTILKEPQ